MKITTVTSLYRSAPYVDEFYRRMKTTLEGLGVDFNVVMVNDGSPDNALELALEIHRADGRLQIVDLSRNFGHHKALMTGLRQADGDLVFVIDCDLEEAPETIELFYREYLRHKGEVDVVFGIQQEREGRLVSRIGGMLFYKMFNILSPVKIPNNWTLTRLMTRPYVEAVLEHRETELVLGGIFLIAGFRQLPILIRKSYKGHTSYTFMRRLTMTIDSIVNFTGKPLEMIFYMGIAVTFLTVFVAFYLLFLKFFRHVGIEGWVSLMLSIWGLGGILLFCTGLLGLYVSKIFAEVKQRPLSIVRKIYK